MEWPLVRLAELAARTGGGTPSRKVANYWGPGLPWFTVADLDDELHVQPLSHSRESITEDGLQHSAAQRIPTGAVVISTRVVVGKVGVAANDLATNQDFCSLIPKNTSSLDSRFLAYFLLFIRKSLRHQQRGLTISGITTRELDELQVPLPPLSEQRRIVEILDQADRLRRLRAEADAKADRILSALFINMFGRSSSVGLAERLDRLVEIGGTLVDPNQGEYLDLPHVGGEHIEKDSGRILEVISVRESNLRSAKFHFADRHVLYSKIRPYLNKVAYPKFAGLCSADIYPLVPKDDRIGPWFLTVLLRSEEFLAYARSQSDRLRMPKLNRDQLGAYPIPVPDPVMAEAFEKGAEQLASNEERRSRADIKFRRLFDSLLHRAFAGSLTASWREAHMNELIQEMEKQAKALAEVTP